MNIETWAEIRRLGQIEKLSTSAIARRMNLSRPTVRHALARPHFQAVTHKRRSKLDPFKGHIEAILREYPELSSVRLFEKLRALGYAGRSSILRTYVATLRPSLRPVFTRVIVRPGERFEVDWAHCGDWPVEGGTRPLSCFVMVMSFSRMLFLEFVLSQKMELFLACHQHAFSFFDGYAAHGLYDNLKSVVLARHGSTLRFNAEYLDFAGFYRIQPLVCNPRSGHEKGRVESAVKYIRENFLAGRTFTSLVDLNAQACHWRDQIANQRLHASTRQTPLELFEQERPHLQRLPAQPYGALLTRTVLVHPDATFVFDTNRYSVPLSLAHRQLTLKADPHQLQLFSGQQLAAEHSRCWGCYQEILLPAHHQALTRKKRAAGRSLARAEFLTLSPEADPYLKGLVTAGAQPDRHIHDILALVRLYGKAEVCQALAQALGHGAFGSDYIRNLVIAARRRRRGPAPSPPLHLTHHPELLDLGVDEVDLSGYDIEDSEESDP